MFDSSVKISWPAGEPVWIEYWDQLAAFGDVDLALTSDEQSIDGMIDMDVARAEYWPRLETKEACWLVGKDPEMLAPSLGSYAANGRLERLLILWELVSAEEGFVLPVEIELPANALKSPIFSRSLETGNRPFRLFAETEVYGWSEVKSDLPVFYFSGGEARLDLFPFELMQDGLRGKFLLHVISHGFDRCVWDVS